MSKKIIIIWAWEQWEVIKNSLTSDQELYWFIDWSKTWSHIVWEMKDINKFKDDYFFFIWIWNNATRKKVFDEIRKIWWLFTNVIHSTSYISVNVKLWEGVFIWPWTKIISWSTIGDNVYLNTWTIIEHDNTIWDHSHLAPWTITWWGVTISNNVFIWLWSIINDHISISNNTTVWAWSVVIQSINKEWETWVWIPAKKVK